MKHITLLAAFAVALPSMAQVIDGGFESASTDTNWTQFSVNFGTPLCDGSCSGNDPDFAARNGSFFAWFGGTPATGTFPEVGGMFQYVNIPTGTTASINVWVRIQKADSLGIDSAVVAAESLSAFITMADTTTYADYAQLSLDVSSLADGATHIVFISGIQHSGATDAELSNVFMDDVELVVDGNVVSGLFENEALPGFRAYPNPANDVIELSFNAMKGAATVTLTDMAGHVVSRRTLGEIARTTARFDSSALANGVYTVSLEQAGKVQQQRVVVAH